MPIDSVAQPFVYATGVNIKAGTHGFTRALHDEHIAPQEAKSLAEIAARNFLTTNAQDLRSKGFNDPAAVLFAEENGSVGFVVVDSHRRNGASEAKALFPDGAEKLGSTIFMPIGY
jgi:hypothetical protein